MSNSPPATQQLSRRRQSRRADRRLSQSMNAATTNRGGDDDIDDETPGEMTRLMNNNNYSNISIAQQRRQSKLSASISSFQSSYNSIFEEEEESSNKEQQNNDTSTPNDMYNTTLKAATEHIFGLYAVEVWRFDDSIDLLQSIPLECSDDIDKLDIDEENPVAKATHHTLYIRRKPQEADEKSPSFQASAKEAYDQLTDTNSNDYLYQLETQPGIGLAGSLWSEATVMSRNNNLSRMRKQLRKVTIDHDDDEEHDNIIENNSSMEKCC